MLPRGRPPGPGTAEEKAAIRREKVRLNVKAYRERKKQAEVAAAAAAAAAAASNPSTNSASASQYLSPAGSTLSINNGADEPASSSDHHDTEDDGSRVIIRSRPSQKSKSDSALSKVSRKNGLMIWATPTDAPIFTDAFISVFRKSFLPIDVRLPMTEDNVTAGSMMLVTPCSPWSMSAYNLANQQEGGALKSGILAIGLILNALQNNSSELKVASLQMQRQAIVQLRNELEPITVQPHRNRSAMSIMGRYLSCLTVTMFELIQSGFSAAILKHVKALNSLIEMVYADPDVDTVMTDLIMEDFGMLEMIFCLKYSVGSVLRHTRQRLARKRRERGLNNGEGGNVSVYGDILDMVDELPSLIVQVKYIQSQPLTPTAGEKVRQISHKLIRIGGDLEAWNKRFEVLHGQILVKETFSDQAANQTGLRKRIKTYEHGAVGLFVYLFLLHATDASIDATTMLVQLRHPQVAKKGLASNGASAGIHTGTRTSLPRPPPALGSQKLNPTRSEEAPVQNGTQPLNEQLEVQRRRARIAGIHILDLIDGFSHMARCLSGQSLLVAPAEITRQVLDKEQIRLGQDLQMLSSDDYTGIAVNGRHREDVAAALSRLSLFESSTGHFGVAPED